MRPRTRPPYSVLANVRRTREEFRLARIADPRMALVLRKGELVPMFRTAHECAMLGPNAHGLVPSPDRSTRIGGAKFPPLRPRARAHAGSAVANPTITVAL
jgi:hypothetical protein